MANVGTAYVAIMPSMDGFAKAICKDFGSAGSSAGKTFGDGLSSGTEKGTSKSKSSLSNLAATAKDQAGYMGLAFEESGARLKAAITQSGAWQTLTGYATSASNGIKSAFAGIKEGISSKLSGAASAVKAGLFTVGSIGQIVMTAAAAMIPLPLKSIASKTGQLLSTVSGAVKSGLSNVASAGSSIMSAASTHIVTPLKSMASTVGTILSPIASTAKAALAPMASALGQAGSEAASKLKEGISKAAGHVAGALSTAAKAAGAGAAAVVTAVSAVTGAALTSYADYEQLVGGVDKLFGSASGKLQSYAAEAYRTSGLSANQYMEQATSFSASLIASCAGDTAKAADYANLAMTTMSDNVNVFGSNMGDVQNAFQGFAKQNYTMLDNLKLGYGGTQAEMQRLIADANKLPGVMREGSDLTIDSYADVVEAIARVQQTQGIAGTTAKEAASTISGSIGMAKAAWENFLTGLGRDDVDFSQLTEQLLTSIGAVAANVAPRVAQIGQGIIQAFPTVLAGLGAVLAPVLAEALSTAWNVAAQALSSVGLQLPTVDSSQVMAAFQQLADFMTGTLAPAFQPVADALGNLVSTVGPLLLPLVAQIAAALAGAAPIIAAIQATVINVATQIMAVVMPILTDILTWVNANMPLIQSVVTTVMTGMQQAIGAALAVIQTVWNAVWPVIQAVLTAVMAVIAAVVSGDMSGIQGIIDTVLNAISSVWNSIWGAISSFLSGVWDSITSSVSIAIAVVSAEINQKLCWIKAVWDSAWDSVKSFFGDIWDGIKNAASEGIDNVCSTVTGIKDSIVGFFSNAGSWLYDSGKAILNGLKDGIMGAVDRVKGAVSDAVQGIRNLFPFSPAKEGPFSGHGYTTYSGKALMGDFAKSISAQTGKVVAATSGVLSAANDGLTASISAERRVSVSGGTKAASYDGALARIEKLLVEISAKDGGTYMDADKVSSALYSRSKIALAGRGIA